MTQLLAVPLLGCLAAAGVATLVRQHLWLRRVVAFTAALVVLVVGVTLLVMTRDGDVLSMTYGAWPRPFGITFAADAFSALMIVLTGLMTSVCLLFAALSDQDRGLMFHTLTTTLIGGVCAAFLSADLFHLYVAFEVMLIASYGLVFEEVGTGRSVTSKLSYLVSNLLASTFLLMGIAFVYANARSVDFVSIGATDPTPGLRLATIFLFVAFAVKAGVAPMHGWLAQSYPATSPATAALFSGLLTKVGVYGFYRMYGVLHIEHTGLQTLMLVFAALTMVIGVLGAFGAKGMRTVLSFHISSQIGYMLLALGLPSAVALAAGVTYIVHHIIVKTALFLFSGAVESEHGTDRLDRLGGIARKRPLAAAGFLIAALGLAGIPPTSGFFAKLFLLSETFRSGEYLMAALAVAVSFLTLASMLKIWHGVYWGAEPSPVPMTPEGEPESESLQRAGDGSSQVRALPRVATSWLGAPGWILAAASLAIGLYIHPLMATALTAGERLVAPPSTAGEVAP